MQRVAELAHAADAVEHASSVAVVGGGYVGVELAAEIAGRHGKAKRVVLISASRT